MAPVFVASRRYGFVVIKSVLTPEECSKGVSLAWDYLEGPLTAGPSPLFGFDACVAHVGAWA